MTWKPEEFHGLSDAEAVEMKELYMSRVEYDRHRLCMAYGALYTSLISLRAAQRFFKQHTPELAAKLGNVGAQLDDLVPDYGAFSASMKKKPAGLAAQRASFGERR